MRRYIIILICVIALAVAAVGVYFLLGGNRTKSFGWEGKAAYKISSNSVVKAGSEKVEASITANGYFKTAPGGIDEKFSIVYAALRDFKLQSSYGYERAKDVAAIENSIIMIKFDKDGSIGEVILSPEISKETADAVRNLIYAAEIVLPSASASFSSWESVSVNGMETSMLSFTRDKGNMVSKRRTSVDVPNVKTQITNSQYTAEISKTFWLKSLSGSEMLTISTPVGSVIDVSTDTAYQSIPFDDSILTGGGIR